jgi:probable rRNA maturation factor
LEATTKHLDAAADADVPPRSWADIVSACAVVCQELVPTARVALRVVDDAAMRRLNREFRGLDHPTDVLAFPADSADGSVGDIAVNWQAAQRQAAEHGHPPAAEAVALFTHGLLHLVGFDHDSEAARRRMDIRTYELCKTAGFEVKSFGH